MGYSVVTTVLSPAASYDLTDLPTAKLELSISSSNTENDSWLSDVAIPQVSRSIQRYIKRPIAPEFIQDVFDIEQDPYPYQTPGGFPQLELSRWPVLAVVSVVQTVAPGSPPTLQTLTEGKDFRTDPNTGRLLRLNPFTGVGTNWEAIPVTVRYTAGHGALVEENNTVPAVAPFTVTVQQAATFSADQSVTYANGTGLVSVPSSPMQGQYSVDADDGAYTFNEADAGQALAFAYSTLSVPPDLAQIALELITARFRAKGRDPLLIEETFEGGMGTKRYWFDTSEKSVFPPDIQDALDEYRVPTLA